MIPYRLVGVGTGGAAAVIGTYVSAWAPPDDPIRWAAIIGVVIAVLIAAAFAWWADQEDHRHSRLGAKHRREDRDEIAELHKLLKGVAETVLALKSPAHSYLKRRAIALAGDVMLFVTVRNLPISFGGMRPILRDAAGMNDYRLETARVYQHDYMDDIIEVYEELADAGYVDPELEKLLESVSEGDLVEISERLTRLAARMPD